MDGHITQKMQLLAGTCALCGALAVLPMSAGYAAGVGAGNAGAATNAGAGAGLQGSAGANTTTGATTATGEPATGTAGQANTGTASPTDSTMQATGNANSNLSTEPTNYGSQSSSHISTQGQMNTNGPNATNRTLGQSRAATRHHMHTISHKTHHWLHTTSTALHHRMSSSHRLHTQSTAYTRSSSHMGSQGQMNTNGPNANQQLYGTQRAQTRANPNATGLQNQAPPTTPPTPPPGTPQ